MAKVTGLGGIFFKCRDARALGDWYRKYLGFDISEDWNGVQFRAAEDATPDPSVVWSPFAEDTEYFNPSAREVMINFRVDDLDGVLENAHKGGAKVFDTETHSYGRFGWFIDPEGYKIELWEPVAES